MLPGRVLEYFWLIAAALMLLTAALVHARAGALVRARRVTREERRRFALGLAAWSAGFCLVVQVVVWMTGETRPACLAALPPTTPASLATNVVTLVGWAALLLWVWIGRGADTLARFAPAIVGRGSAGRTYGPAQVRRFVTGGILIATVGSVVASMIVPPPPDCRGGPPQVSAS
jgi:hypothetical protein